MKIAFDVSGMNKLSEKRGIGYYAQNLFDSIKKYTSVDIELVKEKISLKHFDLIHFPFFDIYQHTLPFKVEKPAIVTIHDLIPLQFANHYSPGIRGKINWQLQKHALKNIRSVIAVSNTVKADIEKLLKIPAQDIFVVYSAPSEKFQKIQDEKYLKDIARKHNLPEDFVLFVGNINWNKNILNTTEAVLKSGQKLVIVGSAFLDKSNLDHPEKKSFKAWLEKYANDSKIKVIGFMETEELAAIMNLAKCLIFVSFYEGFGLPILEAQASGLPVITSKVSAAKEIVGDSGILVDPENVDEIVKSLNSLFRNFKRRENLIKAGLKNVQKFSWEKTALETVKIYEEILN